MAVRVLLTNEEANALLDVIEPLEYDDLPTKTTAFVVAIDAVKAKVALALTKIGRARS